MGEEEKKEAKPKEEEKPKPEEVVMRVYMHCEGCARKVKKILKGFDGVEDVIADSKAHKVLVKGKKAAADPMKVVERVQKKTGRKVELLSPIPPPPEEKKEEEKEEPEPPKPEEKKEPPVIAVVLKVHMHCEACAQGIKKRILKMKGVQSAEPDLKASEVTVKGVFEEAKLAEYVHKRTGKHAAIIKSEPVAPLEKAAAEGGDEKKAAEGGDEKEEKEEKKDGKDDGGNGGGDEKKEEKEKEGGNADGEEKDKDKEKDPAAIAAANLYLQYPRFAFPAGYYPPGPSYAYPPPYPPSYPPSYQPSYPPYPSHPAHNPSQIFSDENPNACSVM
uniref:HMA domain-containing protein n=1 Tax=Oryza brachyantha TaxID=4533 RepID=J3LXA2_ORYBR